MNAAGTGPIAYFTYQLGNYSGAAFQALELAGRLCPTGFIIFNRDAQGKAGRRRPYPNVLVVDLPRNKLLQAGCVLGMALRARVRIFHLHGFVPMGLLAGILLGGKIVLKSTLAGEDDAVSLAGTRWGRLKLWALRFVDVNVVLSEQLRRLNLPRLGPERIRKIPNGVVLGSDPPGKGPIFCTVGVISPRKRTLEAILYFHRNYAHIPGAKLYVVGPASQADGLAELDAAYVERCRAAAGPVGAVEFTGKLSKPETRKIYRASKALIFFSEREGMPNVLLEAMAENCVPIVTPIGGVSREIIEPGRDGFVLESLDDAVPMRDIDAVSESKAPYERIKARFRIETVAAEYESLYGALTA